MERGSFRCLGEAAWLQVPGCYSLCAIITLSPLHVLFLLLRPHSLILVPLLLSQRLLNGFPLLLTLRLSHL